MNKPTTNNQQLTTAVRAENLSKRYSLQKHKTMKELLPAVFSGQETRVKFNALYKLNFEVEKGETLGILGKNGSGKSTLLKLIAGVTKPSDGRITVNGRIAPLIELGAGFHPELTGRENVYLNGSILGIKHHDMENLYPEIVKFSQLESFMDQPIKFYSSGMYMRLAFAVAVAETPDILLVDEILAVGDVPFQKKCLDRMRQFREKGSTMIMVSHNVDQLKAHCSQGLVLNKGKQIYLGTIEKAIELYEEMMQK